LASVESIADRVGDVASFFAGRSRRDRVTSYARRRGLQGEDLA
jgi:hypothetical protein